MSSISTVSSDAPSCADDFWQLNRRNARSFWLSSIRAAISRDRDVIVDRSRIAAGDRESSENVENRKAGGAARLCPISRIKDNIWSIYRFADYSAILGSIAVLSSRWPAPPEGWTVFTDARPPAALASLIIQAIITRHGGLGTERRTPSGRARYNHIHGIPEPNEVRS